MKFGHRFGNPKQQPQAQDWYQRYFEEHLARIEAEYAAQQAPPPSEEDAA